MLFEDLIPFGKLDSNMDEDGFIIFHKYKNFEEDFLDRKDFFLILKDDSVRYVTLKKIRENKFIELKFEDAYFIKSMLKEMPVRIAISNDEIEDVKKSNGLIPYNNLKVFFNNEMIGTVISSFFNGAYDVLEISINDDKEIMIPAVDKYIEDITDEAVFLKNAEELIRL